MKFCVPLAALAATVSLAGQQYKTPAFEVSGGFSTIQSDDGPDYYGVSGAWMANLNRRVGVVAEASVLFGEIDLSGSTGIPDGVDTELDRTLSTVLVGPRIRVVGTDRYTFSLHALGGWGRLSSEGLTVDSEGVPQVPFDAVWNQTAAALGGTFDLRLTNRMAWRIQPDWLWVNGNTGAGGFRLSTGLVIRFGSR